MAITYTLPRGEVLEISHVTSDQHVGHRNIARLADRPFDNSESTDEMDDALVDRWNSVVDPDDVVLVLGDVALGKFVDSMETWTRFNGTKLLVPGNHDRVSSVERASRRERFSADYVAAGFIILPEIITVEVNGQEVLASHYPYAGDSHDADRYAELRPVNEGLPLLHGHTHSPLATDPVRYPRQFHVGVEAHNLTPVPATVIEEWVAAQI